MPTPPGPGRSSIRMRSGRNVAAIAAWASSQSDVRAAGNRPNGSAAMLAFCRPAAVILQQPPTTSQVKAQYFAGEPVREHAGQRVVCRYGQQERCDRARTAPDRRRTRTFGLTSRGLRSAGAMVLPSPAVPAGAAGDRAPLAPELVGLADRPGVTGGRTWTRAAPERWWLPALWPV